MYASQGEWIYYRSFSDEGGLYKKLKKMVRIKRKFRMDGRRILMSPRSR
ncbi:hypothetical protein IFO66_23410 [Paenibacillus sp. CAU 1523]|uniref:Uncharacterized protein n=1 Tax=Paenibacillus arenosi TaxID=2774142 RepID=A0ABR9B4C5_9BACL|nr:hypothetical protein [Paenibacillus arenosi]